MEYTITNPLTIQLLKLFKELSKNGVVDIFCAIDSVQQAEHYIPKWTGFTKLTNIDEEDKARIQFLCEVLEPGLWDQITTETYLPLEGTDTEQYPEGAAYIPSVVISCFIGGEITERNVSGYYCDDVLYLPYEDVE